MPGFRSLLFSTASKQEHAKCAITRIFYLYYLHLSPYEASLY
ncbi:MAG: hypothetical protein OFPII_10740 [Osedax symbiont Rs1]|nr:MAG: hypothetical protein OFPII_10740 [Osedax symbiont Rs1]